ncbi:MAG: alpha-ketoglutarate-dependent dioxygenase AlkB [Pseudomonadota bacterium]|nr:alpha-ketoglutarate-dependent dioxygenase AlkB [Pseudomonadota bacterium]
MQHDLLYSPPSLPDHAAAAATQHAQTIQLADAELSYIPSFYDSAASAALFTTLINETPWRQDTLRFGGKEVLVPRLQAWYGDKRYGYSGLRLAPLPWTPTLAAIRERVANHCGIDFNSVLINYYRNGTDSVAWHSDDERELGPDPHIASLSLGAARRFDMKHRTHKAQRMRMLLENGSLLVMGSGMQRHWIHQLPKDSHVTDARLNLTFRLIH